MTELVIFSVKILGTAKFISCFTLASSRGRRRDDDVSFWTTGLTILSSPLEELNSLDDALAPG
jgi:hypothetical protein